MDIKNGIRVRFHNKHLDFYDILLPPNGTEGTVVSSYKGASWVRVQWDILTEYGNNYLEIVEKDYLEIIKDVI